MALIMTRECGLGPLLNNYIRVMGISVRTNETYGSFIDILVKCYLSKESRDFEKMKQYIIDNNLIPIATNTAQADYLNLYWNKPNVLSVGEMSISGPVDLKDYAKKTQSQILAIAYGAIIEKKSAFGFKNSFPGNIIENDLETQEQFIERVVDPFLSAFNALA